MIIALILGQAEYSVAACVGASITLRALGISGSVASITEAGGVLESLSYVVNESWADVKLLFRGNHYDILYSRGPQQQILSASIPPTVAVAKLVGQLKNSDQMRSVNMCSTVGKNPVASLENEVYGLKGD